MISAAGVAPLEEEEEVVEVVAFGSTSTKRFGQYSQLSGGRFTSQTVRKCCVFLAYTSGGVQVKFPVLSVEAMAKSVSPSRFDILALRCHTC